MKKRDGLSAGSDLGAPHDRGALQPGGHELPGSEGAHRVLLSEMQGSGTLGSVGVPSAAVAKSYMLRYELRGHQGLSQGGRLQLWKGLSRSFLISDDEMGDYLLEKRN